MYDKPDWIQHGVRFKTIEGEYYKVLYGTICSPEQPEKAIYRDVLDGEDADCLVMFDEYPYNDRYSGTYEGTDWVHWEAIEPAEEPKEVLKEKKVTLNKKERNKLIKQAIENFKVVCSDLKELNEIEGVCTSVCLDSDDLDNSIIEVSYTPPVEYKSWGSE